MSRSERDFDVLVAGCGPTGATVAALLGNAGLSVLVVDPEPEPYKLPRAVAIDDDSMRILRTVPGLAERIAGEMIVSPRVQYTTFGGALLAEAEPELAQTPSGYSALSLFHQPTFEAELGRTLEAMETVTVRRGSGLDSFEQDADGVTAQLSGTGPSRVRVGWLLGCDGASSAVRKAIGSEFEGSTFEQPWVVADVFVEGDQPHPAVVEFICDPARPIVTMPMPGGRRRWEFMLLPGESHEAMLESAQLERLIRTAGWTGGYEVERAVVYTFHARTASSWSRGRVFLLGDSAHVTPPFAGQGMNSGIRDAGNIWWKLAAVEAGAAGPVLLDSYEQERRGHVQEVINLSVRLGAIVQTANRRVARLRDVGIRSVMRVPRLEPWSRRLGWKPNSVIRQGWIQGGSRRLRGLAGTQMPTGQVRMNGEQLSLDDAIGTRFAVVSEKSDPWPSIGPATRAVLERYGSVVVTTAPSSKCAAGVIEIGDDAVELRKWLKRARGGTVVVRPDRFVHGIWRGVG